MMIEVASQDGALLVQVVGGVLIFQPGGQVGRIDNLFNERSATFGTYFKTDALANLVPSPLPADANPRSVTPMTAAKTTATCWLADCQLT